MLSILSLLLSSLLAGPPPDRFVDPDPLANAWFVVDSSTATARVRRGDRRNNGSISYRIQWTIELAGGQLATFEIPNAPHYRDYSARSRQAPWDCTGPGTSTSTNDVKQKTTIPPYGPSVDGALQNMSRARQTCTFTLYVDNRSTLGPSAEAYPISVVIHEQVLPPGATASDLLLAANSRIGPGALGIRGANWVYTLPVDGGATYRYQAPVHALLGVHQNDGTLFLACVRALPCWTGERGETGPALPIEGPVEGVLFEAVRGQIGDVRRRVLNDLAATSEDVRVLVAAVNANLDRFSKTRYTLDADAEGWWIEPYGLRERARRAPLAGLELVASDAQLELRCSDGSDCIQSQDEGAISRLVLELYDNAPIPFFRDRFADIQRLAATAPAD